MSQARRLTRNALTPIFIAVIVYVSSFRDALAHTGHTHGQGGFDVNGIVVVAATAAAMVILYVLATWFFRLRDSRNDGSNAGFLATDRVERLEDTGELAATAGQPPPTQVQ